jgi:DNA (cytosine-5)-methyltransferase 1
MQRLTSIEICAGAGGQAWGLELAGFEHEALVENDAHACETLRRNRDWLVFGPHLSTQPKRRRVTNGDVRTFDATPWKDRVDLLGGGVPCPPFSKAGKQLGADDERDLFPAALDLVDDCQPRAVMLENVPGIMDARFEGYRELVQDRLEDRGYRVWWDIVQSSDFGVPQLRPRAVLVAIEAQAARYFTWPNEDDYHPADTVGDALYDLMASDGWYLAEEWRGVANRIAPTLVGGSKKHGGPDLGPTRAKREWERLGVNALKLADRPPAERWQDLPLLTVEMAAILQGFDPEKWQIYGGKTAAYRQIGNAFPPPVARAFGNRIRDALRGINRYPEAGNVLEFETKAATRGRRAIPDTPLAGWPALEVVNAVDGQSVADR